MAEGEGKDQECLEHSERAIALGENCVRLAFEPDLIDLLATMRTLLARRFIRRGDPERAFVLIKVNLRMFDELWTHHRDPVVAIWRVLARLHLHEFQTGPASNSAPPSGDTDSLELLASSETEKRSAESWAKLVACCLAASPASINPANHHLHRFAVRLVERMAWLRRSDKTAEAIRHGDRMLAFAQLIAARYPREPASHVLLSEAFTQLAKNAWQTGDRAAVERNWRLTLGCARPSISIRGMSTPLRKRPTSRFGWIDSKRTRRSGTLWSNHRWPTVRGDGHAPFR